MKSHAAWCFVWSALVISCSGGAPAAPTSGAQAEPEAPAESASARYVPAEPASASLLFDAPARVVPTPEDSAVISAPLALRVLRVRVRPGQEVKQGEPLVDVAMPELIRALGALHAADLRIQGYSVRRERLKPLVDEGLARSVELADLESQIALARADRESAHAVLRAAGVGDDAGAGIAQSGALSLRAPIAGVVVAAPARVGAMWEPNGGPLVELAQATSLLIEARFQALPPSGARFAWRGPTGDVLLSLVRVSPRAEPADGSRVLWLTASHDAGLVPGAIGRVRAQPEQAWVVVPRSALTMEGAGAALYVEGVAEPKRVTWVQGTATQAVVSGIEAGTRVLATAPSGGAP
jgi:membrane fusion protein, heavy metal efflux system